MNTLILNDVHVAVKRMGGTTIESAQALRDYVRTGLEGMLSDHEGHVIINGDFFDGFAVDTVEVVKAYDVLTRWLCNYGNKLTMVMGNHDGSAKADKMSSFHLLCHFLHANFPGRNQVQVIDHNSGFCRVDENIWAISHQLNQTLFDMEINKACAKDGQAQYLLLHCNIKNTFAEHSDHSLNLSNEQLGNLMKAGWTLVVGHEHQGYELRGGRVIVTGCQQPTSVSDCIGEKSKRAIRITDKGHEFITTWVAQDSYAEVDWTYLPNIGDNEYQFIRVVGDATAAQSAEVVNVIAKFRQRSKAFVVTNATKVDGHSISDDAKVQTIEAIKSFDVVGEIMKHLDEREQAVVKGLLGEQACSAN